MNEVQLKPAITDVEGPTIFICYLFANLLLLLKEIIDKVK